MQAVFVCGDFGKECFRHYIKRFHCRLPALRFRLPYTLPPRMQPQHQTKIPPLKVTLPEPQENSLPRLHGLNIQQPQLTPPPNLKQLEPHIPLPPLPSHGIPPNRAQTAPREPIQQKSRDRDLHVLPALYDPPATHGVLQELQI